jgi:hypothetical protein
VRIQMQELDEGRSAIAHGRTFLPYLVLFLGLGGAQLSANTQCFTST